MNSHLKRLGRRPSTLPAALTLLTLAPGAALASAEVDAPAPGLFGLLALGVVGAIAVARGRQ